MSDSKWRRTVVVINPQGLHARPADLIVKTATRFESNVEIVNSVLGPNCLIEERARIENSVLLSGTRVGKAAEISDSVVGKGCLIGRYAKVSGATLGDKTSLTDYTVV